MSWRLASPRSPEPEPGSQKIDIRKGFTSVSQDFEIYERCTTVETLSNRGRIGGSLSIYGDLQTQSSCYVDCDGEPITRKV